MLEITTGLEKQLDSQTPQYRKQVLLYVKKWNGSAYVFDDAVDITDYITSDGGVSPILWKLDKVKYNQWELSNCTITFNNSKQKFKQGFENGFFGTDKLLYGSKIVVKAGAKIYDESTETEYIFTGFIYQDPTYRPDGKTVDIVLRGHLANFSEFAAETISTPVTDELVGSGSGTEFTVTNDGSGFTAAYSSVKKGLTVGGAGSATELLPDDDFTLSDENDYDNPLKVTLNQALLGTESLWVTYVYWFKDKSIEWIVGQICDTVGVTAPNREISPAIFSTDATNNFTQTDETDFDLGTNTNTEQSTGEVLLKQTFHADNKISVSWTDNSVTNFVYPVSGYDATSIRCIVDSGDPSQHYYAYTAATETVGTWIFNKWGGSEAGGPVYFHFISDTGNPTSTNGYALKISGIYLYLVEITAGSETILANAILTTLSGQAYHEIRISRDSSGNFNLLIRVRISSTWQNQNYLLNWATDTTHNTPGYIIAEVHKFLSGGSSFLFSDIAESDLVQTNFGDYYPYGIYETPTIDGTASLTTWGRVLASAANATNTSSVIQWAESSDDITYSSYVDIENTGTLPATERYVKIRMVFNSDGSATPTLAEWNIDWKTSTVTIPLVNLTGLNCYDALVQLAEMVSYEIGFKGNDVFIFRPRESTIASVGEINGDNFEGIDYLSEGIDRIFNRIDVQYGIYIKTVDSETEGDASPNSLEKYGLKEYGISSSQLLPAKSVNVADAIAPTVYAYTKDIRKRATLSVKFFVQFELGDILDVNIPENSVFPLWLWGDNDRKWGDTDIVYYNQAFAKSSFSLYNTPMRIEGIEFDVMAWKIKYDLVEVV